MPEAKRGFVLLPRRWVVERSFAWTTRFRRLVKDYERLGQTLADLHLIAFVCLMLKTAAGRGGLAGVALIDEGEFDTVAGGGLNVAGELVDGRAIADIGGRDMQREKMAERIDGQMQLRALLALGAVVAGASAAFGCRAQRPAVDDGTSEG